MVFTKNVIIIVKQGSTYFMCMGTFQVRSVRILNEDLARYTPDIHKTMLIWGDSEKPPMV